MSNALAKDLEMMFEDYVEGYDAACVISMEAETGFSNVTDMQRAGDTFYKRQNLMASVVNGLDISGSTPTDVIDRFVPTVYRSPDNVLFYLDAKEMRDPVYKQQMGKAAAQRLAAEIDKNIYSTVSAQASIFVKKTGAIAWDDFSTAEALMVSRGIVNPMKKAFLNPFDYAVIAKDLGNKAYMGDWSKSAYERSQVPDIAGFRTFRTDNVSNVTVTGTVSGTTIKGAQSHTVTAMTGDVPTDNRRMTLLVQGANVANIKAGDAFAIPGVNAVHMVDKSDTGQLMTFRVITSTASSSDRNLVITPAIVASGPYQNVTVAAPDTAPLVFLNTATKPSNPFWAQGAVTLDYGRLAFPTGEGANVMTATTKQGVPLIMAYQFNSLTGKTSCRFTTLYATTVLDPEKCGVVVANQ